MLERGFWQASQCNKFICNVDYLELKLFCAMYDWVADLSSHSFSNMPEFVDLCTIR